MKLSPFLKWSISIILEVISSLEVTITFTQSVIPIFTLINLNAFSTLSLQSFSTLSQNFLNTFPIFALHFPNTFLTLCHHLLYNFPKVSNIFSIVPYNLGTLIKHFSAILFLKDCIVHYIICDCTFDYIIYECIFDYITCDCILYNI